MIIMEREHSYFMETQNDHAKIAGEITRNCKDDYFFDHTRTQEVQLAMLQ